MVIVSGLRAGSFSRWMNRTESMPRACWSLLWAWISSHWKRSSLAKASFARHSQSIETWDWFSLKHSALSWLLKIIARNCSLAWMWAVCE